MKRKKATYTITFYNLLLAFCKFHPSLFPFPIWQSNMVTHEKAGSAFYSLFLNQLLTKQQKSPSNL